MRFLEGMYRDKDGGGSGGTTDGTNAPPPGDGNQTTPPTGNTPGDEDPESGDKVTFSTDQQAALDKIVSDRLARAREKWESDQKSEQERIKKEAEQKRLKDEAKWKELAEQHEAKIAELEPLSKSQAEQLKAYQGAVEEMLNARLEALGDAAKTAVEKLPGELDALAKLTWLNANETLFSPKTSGNGLGTPPGRKPARRPVQSPPSAGEEEPSRPLIRF